MSIIDWWKRNNEPDKKPTDGDGTIGLPKYLQAWNLLRKIQIKKLFPAVVSVSTVVFFAISGVLAWAVLFGSFICKLFKMTFKWFKIW